MPDARARRPAGRPRTSRCWSTSPARCATTGLTVGSGDVLTYARAVARSTRPTCSTSTGPAARRWSPGATRSPSTTGCSGGSSSTAPPRTTLPGSTPPAAARSRHGPPSRSPRPSPGEERERARRRGSAWSPPTARTLAEQGVRAPARPRSWPRSAGSCARMRLTPPRRRTRRTRPARSGRHPDLRRTVRETMRLHGEPAQPLRWRRRRLRQRPLILILDVSGSMADYSRNLLQFAYPRPRTSTPGWRSSASAPG